MATELRVEVLHVEGLPPERPGQLRPLRPSVEVTFQGQSARSSAAKVLKNAAAFGWKAFFGVGLGDSRIGIRVYNQRGSRPSAEDALVGDGLIGEAVLPLLEVVPSEGLLFTCSLRKDNKSTGRVAVHYELAPMRSMPGYQGNYLVSNAFGETICTADSLPPCQVVPGCRCIPASPGASPSSVKGLRLGNISARHGEAPGVTLLASASPKPKPIETGSPYQQGGSGCKIRSTSSSSSSGSSNRGSEEGFQSALEEGDSPSSQARSPAAAQKRETCERVAESYVQARTYNDIGSLENILARDAVISVPRPLGGSTQHRGWNEIEAYLFNNPAAPDNFRDWTHVGTEDGKGPDGIPKATVVRWVGKVYKYGLWHQVRCDFLIDASNLVRRVSMTKGR